MMVNKKIGVTFHVRAKHADLWAAAKKLGSQSALARHLCLNQTTVGNWINFKRCPSTVDPDVERKLFALTGKLLDELFPEELRNSDLFRNGNTKEIRQELSVRLLSSNAVDRLTLPSPLDVAAQREQRELVQESLRFLPKRKRDVIELRFGIGCASHTLEEAAEKMELTRERVRQIEASAVNRLYYLQKTGVITLPDE